MVDVGGVGYELEVSTNVLAAAPAIGQPITLSTHFVVREDAQLLFGFCDTAERVPVAVALEEALVNAMFHGNLERPHLNSAWHRR